MKTLKMFFLMIVPVILFSCNGQHNRNKENTQDTDRNAMLVENAKVASEPQKDEDFVKESANGGMMEVELGRYAEQNALNPRVKNYGAMMVRDHSRANEELKTIASGKNITLPEGLDNEHRNKIDDLKKKSGDEFDKEYIKEMIDDHEKDVSKFRKMMDNNAADPDLKAFASRTLDILLMHLDSAKNVRDALK